MTEAPPPNHPIAMLSEAINSLPEGCNAPSFITAPDMATLAPEGMPTSPQKAVNGVQPLTNPTAETAPFGNDVAQDGSQSVAETAARLLLVQQAEQARNLRDEQLLSRGLS